MKRAVVTPFLLSLLLAVSGLGPGCASVKKSMGGATPASQQAAPKPKLAASASGLKLSTNSVAVTAPAPSAPKTAVAQPPAPAQAVAAPKVAAKTNDATAATSSYGLVGDARISYKLRAGDSVVIFLRGIQPKDDEIQDIIDDTGHLNLPYIGIVDAAGKSTSQLEQQIQQAYIDGQIYKTISVSVVLPAQYYFVRGEVKGAGRFPLVPGTTVLQGIAAAGGYTDFADPRVVKIIRGEKVFDTDARDIEKHPERDVVLQPGDVVVVSRSLF